MNINRSLRETKVLEEIVTMAMIEGVLDTFGSIEHNIAGQPIVVVKHHDGRKYKLILNSMDT